MQHPQCLSTGLRTGSIATPSYLTDSFGRPINYLRLAITDRCNLRCRYCMPDEGIAFIPHEKILRSEEMERLVRAFVSLGVRKVRLTGGEPFVRKGLVPLIGRLLMIPGLDQVHITTNGVAAAGHLAKLKAAGLSGINLSLDSLDRRRFEEITHRPCLDLVLESFREALRVGLPLKINTVMLDDAEAGELIEIAELARMYDVSVRFIERMPFSGRKEKAFHPLWTAQRMTRLLKERYRGMTPCIARGQSTAHLYRIPGFRGTVGVIDSYTRSFCSQCNKVRITAKGVLKTCLYAKGGLDLLARLRGGIDDTALIAEIAGAVAAKPENGHLAAMAHPGPVSSMAAIGG